MDQHLNVNVLQSRRLPVPVAKRAFNRLLNEAMAARILAAHQAFRIVFNTGRCVQRGIYDGFSKMGNKELLNKRSWDLLQITINSVVLE